MDSGHSFIVSVLYFDITDVNECDDQPCDQLCDNTDGGFECRCNEGYMLAENMMSCESKLPT